MDTKYKGFLLKAQGTIINGKFFQEYKTIPNKQTDLNPWTDNTGLTHRNVLPHKRTEIIFVTPRLYLPEKIELQSLLPDRTLVTLEYWNDEINDYSEGNFYIPDITYEVMMPYSDTILYRPITYDLIEY